MQMKSRYVIGLVIVVGLASLAGLIFLDRKIERLTNAYSSKVYDTHFKTAFTETRVEAAEAELELLRSAMRNGYEFIAPQDHRIYQQFDGKGQVPFKVLQSSDAPWSIDITPMNQAARTAAYSLRSEGSLALDPGFYTACLRGQKNKSSRCISFGVGDVYVVAGQSNAVSSSVVPVRSETGFVTVNEQHLLKKFTNPSTKPVSQSVAWVYAGDILGKEYGRPIGFVNVAEGGVASYRWKPGTDLFQRLKSAIEEHNPRAVLWHQGESDCAERIRPEDSYANLLNMIKESSSNEKLTWVVALATLDGDKGCQIRSAQSKIIQEGVALEGPDTDLLNKTAGHFTTESELRQHGKAWAQKMEEYFYR